MKNMFPTRQVFLSVIATTDEIIFQICIYKFQVSKFLQLSWTSCLYLFCRSEHNLYPAFFNKSCYVIETWGNDAIRRCCCFMSSTQANLVPQNLSIKVASTHIPRLASSYPFLIQNWGEKSRCKNNFIYFLYFVLIAKKALFHFWSSTSSRKKCLQKSNSWQKFSVILPFV